jgi:hypothetical protein
VWLLLPGTPSVLGHTGACTRNICIQAGCVSWQWP